MKTRKIFALLLSVCMLLSIFSVFTMTVNAENDLIDDEYAELWEAKKEYLKKNLSNEFNYFQETFLTVLLYTDVAKEWSYEKVRVDTVNYYVDQPEKFLFQGFHFYIKCNEIEQAIKNCRTHPDLENFGYPLEKSSYLRACVQYFDISKEVLIAANKKMQEDPDSVLTFLPTLNDEELEYARYENGLFCERPLADFMIDALYIEDDIVANNLLLYSGVYFENGLNDGFLVIPQFFWWDRDIMTVEEFAEYDLKPIWVADFIDTLNISEDKITALKAEREYQLANPDIPKNGLIFSLDTAWFYYGVIWQKEDLTPPEVEEFLNDPRVIAKFGEAYVAALKAERARQLKNPSTGEEVYLIPVAIVSLALGALVIYPRRRKIDNI